jgi:hypothetical protein
MEGAQTGSDRACEEGEESKVPRKPISATHGMWLGQNHQISTCNTCTMYVCEEVAPRVVTLSNRAYEHHARTVSQATRISEMRAVFINVRHGRVAPGVVVGSGRACKEGEESKVLECTDCGLGHKHQ